MLQDGKEGQEEVIGEDSLQWPVNRLSVIFANCSAVCRIYGNNRARLLDRHNQVPMALIFDNYLNRMTPDLRVENEPRLSHNQLFWVRVWVFTFPPGAWVTKSTGESDSVPSAESKVIFLVSEA